MSLHKIILSNLQTTSLSLSDLQTATQVSLPTLRKAIQELSDNQWIRVTGQSESSGGRPAMLFGFDDSRYIVISVHLQLPGIRLIATDLNGNILDTEDTFQNHIPTPTDATDEIKHYVRDIQDRLPQREVIGIGIASPGFTAPDTGDILSVGRVAGWQDFPICTLLQSDLHLPVYIANDIDCMAFAEFQHTGISLDKNLVYIGFDEGVKVSMFLDGHLYKGAFGNVGLVTTRWLDTPSDESTRSVLSIQDVNKLFADRVYQLDTPEQSKYQQLLDIQNPRQRVQLILEGQQEICQDITQMVIQTLVRSILMTTYLIQPDILVLGGLLSSVPSSLYYQIEDELYDALPPLFSNHLQIRQGTLTSSNRATLGASYHFLKTYFADPITDPLALLSVQ